MTFLIRDLIPADLDAVTDIYRDAVETGTASYELCAPDLQEMRARYEAIISKGYPYIACSEATGRLVGYAYASAFRTRPAYRWLVEDSIYILPEARGKGIGKMLLHALVNRCTALGFRQMVAVIGGASEASIAVHRSCGFDHAGRLTGTGFKFDRWLDTVFMQRQLGAGTATPADPAAYPGTLS
ncbi:GNAT family N-acetyltransferase [Peteryoungia ipomoeae]|uniref:N-acetyltransferase n=1 Tax=Peteryoungia ipomoeae TaxID=1210932 RepID=A0A4S8P3H5_9HYPH|nr:GNAT family N-acetyltransferase [Peteryoungia ipomoeae]THV22179.1 N-acetyltransferase [Peteryoungia ipomoeae]